MSSFHSNLPLAGSLLSPPPTSTSGSGSGYSGYDDTESGDDQYSDLESGDSEYESGYSDDNSVNSEEDSVISDDNSVISSGELPILSPSFGGTNDTTTENGMYGHIIAVYDRVKEYVVLQVKQFKEREDKAMMSPTRSRFHGYWREHLASRHRVRKEGGKVNASRPSTDSVQKLKGKKKDL